MIERERRGDYLGKTVQVGGRACQLWGLAAGSGPARAQAPAVHRAQLLQRRTMATCRHRPPCASDAAPLGGTACEDHYHSRDVRYHGGMHCRCPPPPARPQVVPHITDAIQDWIQRVAHVPVDGRDGLPDVCVIELGGTVGDIESMPFIEALRQFQFRCAACTGVVGSACAWCSGWEA